MKRKTFDPRDYLLPPVFEIEWPVLGALGMSFNSDELRFERDNRFLTCSWNGQDNPPVYLIACLSDLKTDELVYGWGSRKTLTAGTKERLGIRFFKDHVFIPPELCLKSAPDWGIYEIHPEHIPCVMAIFDLQVESTKVKSRRLVLYDQNIALPSLAGFVSAFFKSHQADTLSSSLINYSKIREAALAQKASLEKLLEAYQAWTETGSKLDDLRLDYESSQAVLKEQKKLKRTSLLAPPIFDADEYEEEGPTLEKMLAPLRLLSNVYQNEEFNVARDNAELYLERWLIDYKKAQKYLKNMPDDLEAQNTLIKELIRRLRRVHISAKYWGCSESIEKNKQTLQYLSEKIYLYKLKQVTKLPSSCVGIDIHPEWVKSLIPHCKELAESAKLRGGRQSDFIKRGFVKSLACIFDHFSIWWRKGIPINQYNTLRNEFIKYGMKQVGVEHSRTLLYQKSTYDLSLPPSVFSDLDKDKHSFVKR